MKRAKACAALGAALCTILCTTGAATASAAQAAQPTPSASPPAACSAAEVTAFGLSGHVPSAPILEPRIHLTQAGRYCLSDDLRQAPLRNPLTSLERPALGVRLILIESDDVDLDLAGRTVENQRRHGVTLIGHFRPESAARRGFDDGRPFVRTSIRNGTLLSPYREGVAIRLVPNLGGGAWARVEPTPTSASRIRGARIAETRHHLEGLTLIAGNTAIVIEGRNNVIRNNRIVVESATAIIATGPGLVLEDNVIEVHDTMSPPGNPPLPREDFDRHPIRLVHADGAIVRNNRIRYVAGRDERGLAAKALPAALRLIDSADVRLEANRTDGFATLVTADTTSTFSVLGNSRSDSGGNASGP